MISRGHGAIIVEAPIELAAIYLLILRRARHDERGRHATTLLAHVADEGLTR